MRTPYNIFNGEEEWPFKLRRTQKEITLNEYWITKYELRIIFGGRVSDDNGVAFVVSIAAVLSQTDNGRATKAKKKRKDEQRQYSSSFAAIRDYRSSIVVAREINNQFQSFGRGEN